MSSFDMRKQKLAGLLVILGLFSADAQAETRKSKIWKVSAAILGAVTIADAQSSMGRPEANAFLRSNDGRFAGRGVALKGVVVGAALGAQWLLTPQESERRRVRGRSELRGSHPHRSGCDPEPHDKVEDRLQRPVLESFGL